MTPSEFIMRDVRCFAGEQRIAIRPLTLLVGENSTGKSTVLGCYQVLARIIAGEKVNFNIPPYQMGAFSNIVRTVHGQKGKCAEFRLGLNIENVEHSFVFTEQGSEPVLSKASIEWPAQTGKIDINFIKPHSNESPRFFLPRSSIINKVKNIQENVFSIDINSSDFTDWQRVAQYLIRPITRSLFVKELSKNENKLTKFLREKSSSLGTLRLFAHSSHSNISNMSPIRSEPLRTYNPLSEEETPEGADVPMYLARLMRTKKQKWEELQKELAQFGKDAGMFDDIYIKGLGKNMGDPFQIQFKIRGPRTNIMDVGYGVSQVLPILVRLLANKNNRSRQFLLQQPEVHLHPSGQAALASLLVNLTKRRKMFLVETHSDYIIDRVRMDIRKNRISPDDVSLVYHAPEKNGVKIHNISFDKEGNMLNVPSGFQQFIAHETDAFLGLR